MRIREEVWEYVGENKNLLELKSKTKFIVGKLDVSNYMSLVKNVLLDY